MALHDANSELVEPAGVAKLARVGR
jgi:hypothetical protein